MCSIYKKKVSIKNYLVLACKSIFFKSVGYPHAKPNKDKFFKQQLNRIKKIKLIHFHSPFSLGKFANKFGKKKQIPVLSYFHTLYYKEIKQYSKSSLIASIILKQLVNTYNKSKIVFSLRLNLLKKLQYHME